MAVLEIRLKNCITSTWAWRYFYAKQSQILYSVQLHCWANEH